MKHIWAVKLCCNKILQFLTGVTANAKCPVYHHHHTTPQPFYGPFSGTTRVSQCQKRTSGLHGARED